jgi:ataxia telangiectasia mutated family protein
VLNLWFSNYKVECINELIEIMISKVPTFFFLPLAYQLCSRLGGGSPNTPSDSRAENAEAQRFDQVLQKLILRMCQDHPHHITTQLFMIVQSRHTSAGGTSTLEAKLPKEKLEVCTVP